METVLRCKNNVLKIKISRFKLYERNNILAKSKTKIRLVLLGDKKP